MNRRLRIPVKAIVNDILEGRTDLELMTRYKISSAADLYRLFNRLIMMGVVEKDDIRHRLPEGWKVRWKREDFCSEAETQENCTHPDAREAPRAKLFGNVEICDMTALSRSYGIEIKDISELGLMVAPIKVRKNEAREFLIKPPHFEDVQSISLVANCRWTDGIRAGFRITRISPSSVKELQRLIKLYSFDALT